MGGGSRTTWTRYALRYRLRARGTTHSATSLRARGTTCSAIRRVQQSPLSAYALGTARPVLA
eukprot:1307742-Rhodomonas_salina.1